MRVIFLDFDGVLNADTAEADESAELWTASWLDTAMVGQLARLVETTGACVVISSSWRQRRSQAELRAILAEHGYLGDVIDVTPRHHVRRKGSASSAPAKSPRGSPRIPRCGASRSSTMTRISDRSLQSMFG